MTLGRPGALLADRYRLDRLVGGAGSAERWQAYDERLARPVTARLTSVGEDTAHEEIAQATLERMARLNHPGVAAVYDVGTVDGLASGTVGYAISEWTDGRTLAQIMATGPQPWPRTADWARQISGALAALHSAGLAHGALGPNSIAIHDDRRVKILDAGLDAEATDVTEAGAAASGDADAEAGGDDGSGAEVEEANSGGGEGDEDGAGESREADGLRQSSEAGEADELRQSGEAGEIGEARQPDEAGEAEESDAVGEAAGAGESGGADDSGERAESAEGAAQALPTGAADDVYALGLLIWEATVGAAPDFVTQDAAAGPELRSARGATLAPDLQPLRQARVPAEMVALLAGLLDADPARRPTASAAETRFAPFSATERVTGTLPEIPRVTTKTQVNVPTPVVAQVQPSGAPRGGPPFASSAALAAERERERRRRRGLLIGLGLLLAAIGVGLGLLLANLNPSNSATPNVGDTAVPPNSPGAVTLPSRSPTPKQSTPSAAHSSAAPATSAVHSSSASPSSSPSASASQSPSATSTSTSASSTPSATGDAGSTPTSPAAVGPPSTSAPAGVGQ